MVTYLMCSSASSICAQTEHKASIDHQDLSISSACPLQPVTNRKRNRCHDPLKTLPSELHMRM